MKETQKAKEYLSRISKIDKLINRLMSTVSTLRSGLVSQNYELKPDKVQSSGQGDILENVIADIDDLERQIDRHIDELVNLKQEAYNAIRNIPDFNQQNILIARYIEGKKWEVIAVEISLSVRQVTRIHGAALLSFAEVNKDVLECPIG